MVWFIYISPTQLKFKLVKLVNYIKINFFDTNKKFKCFEIALFHFPKKISYWLDGWRKDLC